MMRACALWSLALAALLCAAPAWADQAGELYAQAEQAYAANDFNQALELFKKVIVGYPNAPMVDRCLYRVGAIFLRQDDCAKARIYFDKLVREHPGSDFAQEALYHRGLCALRLDQHKQATEDFNAYLALGPGTLRHGSAQLNLARVCAVQGQAGSALNAFSAAWKELPEGAERDKAVIEAQRVAAGVGQPEPLSRLLDSLERGPVRDVIALELARLQIAEGRRDKAQATMARADFSQGPAAIRLEAQRLTQATLPQRVGTREVFVGCVLPLSGRFSVYGEQALKGLLLGLGAFDEPQLEGTVVHLLVRDSQGDPEQAARCVRELAQTQAVAVVGPLLSSEAVQAAAEAQAVGMPLITLTRKERITEAGPFVFRAFTTDESQVAALVEYAAGARGARRCAVLYPQDRYGQAMAADFGRIAAARGVEVVLSIGYATTTVDWHREINKLRQAGAIDALFIPDFSRAVSMIVQQLALLPKRPLLLGPGGWNDPQMATTLGDLLQGCVIADGFFEGDPDPATVKFLQRFQQHLGGRPDLILASAYDVGLILDQQLTRNPSADRAIMRELLLELSAFPGACGPTSFLPNGEIARPLKLITVGPSGLEQLK